MPGILPMKLIKSTNNQTRIAQACDRCRSKKIRCDGIRPCCSQCAAVGFECKTSDKLSRRAFPRGYTESLEERVRALEAEVRDHKDLLDTKDEQIDVLSRLHSFSPYSPNTSISISDGPRRSSSVTSAPTSNPPAEDEDEAIIKDQFPVPQSKTLIQDDDFESFFTGPSSGRAFVEAFRMRMKAAGLACTEFTSDTFFTRKPTSYNSLVTLSAQYDTSMKPPPRMIADLLLTSFFQEYHPLFPVLHRPTFLQCYENLVDLDSTAPNYPHENHEIAQLFLVFAIASAQTEARNSPQHAGFEMQWQRALDAILMNPTFETLQCLVLAQLYCISISDNVRALQYKSLAVSTALRLGLNRNQKDFSLNTLDLEMHKRVFWCVYSLDSFLAAMTGLPMILRDNDVDIEYPSDVDDEYISEKGFLPTLPGDTTKISSAIALFRAARVLSRVLSEVYSGSEKHKLSYSVLQDVEEQLDLWRATLAPHLRLEFANGVPATKTVHSCSPLLVLAYHYIRVLIHRSTVGTNVINIAGSTHALTESSKRIFHIIKLLEERKMGFCFCLNRNDTLLFCGFAILNSSLDYAQNGVQAKENQKIISDIILMLNKRQYHLRREFRAVATAIFNTEKKEVSFKQEKESSPTLVNQQNIRRTNSMSYLGNTAIDAIVNSTNQELFDPNLIHHRSLTCHSNSSRMSLPGHINTAVSSETHRTRRKILSPVESAFANLDLFNWTIDVPHSQPVNQALSATNTVSNMSDEDWEKLVANIDHNQGALIYGDLQSSDAEPISSPESVQREHNRRTSSSAWSSDSWNVHQALHPTAASISSLGGMCGEELVADAFDLNQIPLFSAFSGLEQNLAVQDWEI